MCTALIRCGPDMLSWRVCGVCRECRQRRIDDLVGRCLAEQRSSTVTQSFGVDVTYAPLANGETPIGALVLQYGDVAKLLERLRDSVGRPGDYPSRAEWSAARRGRVRFFCAGEIGALKGRCHWHLLIFLSGPELALPDFGKRCKWDFWPHGFSWLKPLDRKTCAYAAKYAAKGMQDVANYGESRKANYSRVPPLGDDWFADLAYRTAKAGLAVWDNSYTFPDIYDGNAGRFIGDVKRKPKRTQFFMTNTTLLRFLDRYVYWWGELQGGARPPLTEFLVENYFDPLAKREREADPDVFLRYLDRKRARDPLLYTVGEKHSVPPTPVYFRRHVGTMLLPGNPAGVAAGYSDGTVSIGFGSDEPLTCPARHGGLLSACAALGLGQELTGELVLWWRELAPRLDPEGVTYPVLSLEF